MKPSIVLAGSLATALLALGAVGLALGDDDDHDEHRHEHRSRGWVAPGEDVQPVANATYAEECGACHMAYQPGLLPGDAWQQIMAPDALTDHYGDDASLSPDLRQEIAGYLAANAAELSGKSRSHAFSVGDAGAGALPRITLPPYSVNRTTGR